MGGSSSRREKRETFSQKGSKHPFLSSVLSFLRGLSEAADSGVALTLTVLAYQAPSFLRLTLVAPLVSVVAPPAEVADGRGTGVSGVSALKAPTTVRRRGRNGTMVGGWSGGITTVAHCVVPAGVCVAASVVVVIDSVTIAVIIIIGSAVVGGGGAVVVTAAVPGVAVVIVIVVVSVVICVPAVIGGVLTPGSCSSSSGDGGWRGVFRPGVTRGGICGIHPSVRSRQRI